MKRTLLFIACVLASVTMLAQDELTVEDVQNSGCLSETRGEKVESLPTIVLQKDGSILTVEILNYVSNCATSYFDVESNVKDGIGGASSTVTLDVNPVNTSHFITTCECPFNVSFTVHDIEANSFYLNCWWYHGLVELTEGEQFVLEYLSNDVEVDGIFYNLVSGGNVAVVTRNQNGYTGDVSIPESVYYEGVKYSVTSINESTFNDCIGLASVTIPNSVASISQYAFCGCNNLSDVYCYAEAVPSTGVDAFIGSNIGNATLHVPAASVSAYQAVEPWKNFKEIVALEEQMAYRPFLKEGKTWNYREYHHNVWDNQQWTKEISYVINGTTEIDGKTYYKLYRISEDGNNYYCALREEDKKVWQYTSSEGEHLLYDFGMSIGDSYKLFNLNYYYQLTSIKPTRFHDDQLLNVLYYDIYVRQYYSLEPSMEKFASAPIVEGVGCEEGWKIMDLYAPIPTNGILQGEEFLSCYEDGKCIFTADDFNNLTADDDIAYRPFVEEGKVWKVGSTLIRDNMVKFVEYYYFEGDTIINGKTCKQMMRQRYVNPEYPDYAVVMQYPLLSYVGAWYEEDKKVYFYNKANNQFKLMYDFSLNADATFEVDNLSYVIGPRQTGGIEGFKGVYRSVMTSVEGRYDYNTTWLEGVGGIDGPMVIVYYGEENHAQFLMSCTVGDEVIYLNDEYEDGATPMVMESRRHRIDFTHTIKTRPRVPASPLTLAKKTEKEESQLYGDYSNVQLDINLDPLNDAYLVCITNVTGKAVYEKTINAASIVGLDIDISAYAEGRYTVTVENSNEAFTGEIVLGDRTTGISLIPALFQEERAIYNLQGQRISSLQKGLNIVNGQKVFVK